MEEPFSLNPRMAFLALPPKAKWNWQQADIIGKSEQMKFLVLSTIKNSW
jgi:hypothetical protein